MLSTYLAVTTLTPQRIQLLLLLSLLLRWYDEERLLLNPLPQLYQCYMVLHGNGLVFCSIVFTHARIDFPIGFFKAPESKTKNTHNAQFHVLIWTQSSQLINTLIHWSIVKLITYKFSRVAPNKVIQRSFFKYPLSAKNTGIVYFRETVLSASFLIAKLWLWGSLVYFLPRF